MLKLIKQEVLNHVAKLVEEMPNIQIARLHTEFTGLKDEIALLRRQNYQLEQLREDMKKSFTPVVLFEGLLPSPTNHVHDYAWAERPNENMVIHFQPHTTVRLKRITILNGFYDCSECRVANVDLTVTPQGRIVPGTPMACDIELTPANRVYMKLHAR